MTVGFPAAPRQSVPAPGELQFLSMRQRVAESHKTPRSGREKLFFAFSCIREGKDCRVHPFFQDIDKIIFLWLERIYQQEKMGKSSNKNAATGSQHHRQIIASGLQAGSRTHTVIVLLRAVCEDRRDKPELLLDDTRASSWDILLVCKCMQEK